MIRRTLTTAAAITAVALSLSACDQSNSAKNADQRDVTPTSTPTAAHGTPQLTDDPARGTDDPRAWRKQHLPQELQMLPLATLADYSDDPLHVMSSRVTQQVSRMGDLLGAPNDPPNVVPRTAPTDCLKYADTVAAYCGNRIEYRSDLLEALRSESPTAAVLVMAHEAGHHVMAAAGADTDTLRVNVSEARANCTAGAWMATLPDSTPGETGRAFQQSPLKAAGYASYTSLQSGYERTREQVNVLPQCANTDIGSS